MHNFHPLYIPRPAQEQTYRRWSDEERARLRRMVADGIRPAEISRQIGRSIAAIYSRAAKLGIVIPLRENRWSREEQKTLWDLVQQGATTSELMKALPGRTHGSIAWHIHNIGGRPEKRRHQ